MTFQSATPLQGAILITAVAAAVAAFYLPKPRARATALLAASILELALLYLALADSQRLGDLANRPMQVGLLVVAALLALAGLVIVFERWPKLNLLPLLIFAAMPLRLPFGIDGESANLLLPLYLVLAAGALQQGYIAFRYPERDLGAANSSLVLALLGVVALYSAQSLYSLDFAKALTEVAFFFVPFLLLLKLLLGVRWTLTLVKACFAVLVGEAIIFAAIGYWEFGTGELLWGSQLLDQSAFAAYFRISSVFFDPNVLGRFLVMAIVILVALVVWQIYRRQGWLTAVSVGIAFLWGALLLTLSQSSYAALLLGLGMLTAVYFGWRRALVALALAVTTIAIAAVLLAGSLQIKTDQFEGADQATAGRLGLIGGGLELFTQRPLWGWGSGAFNLKFQAEEKAGQRDALVASHTTPVTVLAEQGLIGFAAYLLLLWAACAVLGQALFQRKKSQPARPQELLAARAAIAAILLGIWLHTLLYADFLEDPFVWALAALGIKLTEQTKGTTPTDVRVSTQIN